jgi:hypothetical protein
MPPSFVNRTWQALFRDMAPAWRQATAPIADFGDLTA